MHTREPPRSPLGPKDPESSGRVRPTGDAGGTIDPRGLARRPREHLFLKVNRGAGTGAVRCRRFHRAALLVRRRERRHPRARIPIGRPSGSTTGRRSTRASSILRTAATSGSPADATTAVSVITSATLQSRVS